MASILVSGDTSGSITLSAPAVSGSSVLTLPVATDTLVGKSTTDTLTNKTLTNPIIAGTPTGVGVLTSETAQATTSGTFKDFTGIPSWVKRITVMFSAVSTNGTSNKLIQIGSGSVETTGYLATSNTLQNASLTCVGYTNGFGISSGGAAELINGSATITLLASNQWVCNGAFGYSAGPFNWLITGGKTTSGALDRVRITTVNGTDTFDAGSINILYE